MEKNRLKNLHSAEAAIFCIFLLSVLMVILIHFNPGSIRFASAVTPYSILQPDTVTEEKISEYAGIRRTYTLKLPDTKSATTTGSRLTFYLRHTIVQYSIPGTNLSNDLSEYETPHIGKTPGNYWVSIPIKPEYAGKTVNITLTPVYKSNTGKNPIFMVITRDMQLAMVELPKDGLLLLLSFIAVATGIFLALMAFVIALDSQDKRRIFYLGAVTVLAGLWKLCGLPVLPLLLDFLGIQKEIWFTGAISYLLMMVLSLRLMTLMRTNSENRTGTICFCVSVAAALLLLVLQLTGILELYSMLIWYGIGMALLHVISLFGKKPSRSELLWLLPFFLTMGIDLLIYYAVGSMRSAPAFLIWIIINLIVRSFGFVNEAIHRERTLRKKEEELRDVRIQTMINQIRPHFIYNTLTSIYVLCREDPKLASEVIQNFTAYLQANFTAISAKELIAFSDELQHTKAFVAVESLRYGDKLQIDYDILHTAFRLPALTLQPLVENAIKHCLGKGIGPEHIVVRTRAEKDCAVIIVEDNGPGIGSGATDSEVHVGFQNVKDRLQLMCGGSLEYSSAPGMGTIITVRIPRDN